MNVTFLLRDHPMEAVPVEVVMMEVVMMEVVVVVVVMVASDVITKPRLRGQHPAQSGGDKSDHLVGSLCCV